MEKKNNNTLIVVLLLMFLGLPVLVGCIGILAAIAIPSFLRYTQKSKSSEAMYMTRSLGGAVEMGYLENCKFPEPLPPTFDPTSTECCGGKKCLPAGPVPEFWKSATSTLENPNYFAYSAVPGPDNTFIVTAMADFVCGGPVQTVTVTVQASGNCEVSSSPPVVTNDGD